MYILIETQERKTSLTGIFSSALEAQDAMRKAFLAKSSISEDMLDEDIKTLNGTFAENFGFHDFSAWANGANNLDWNIFEVKSSASEKVTTATSEMAKGEEAFRNACREEYKARITKILCDDRGLDVETKAVKELIDDMVSAVYKDIHSFGCDEAWSIEEEISVFYERITGLKEG